MKSNIATGITVGKSQIEGKGCFAAADFRKWQKIAEYAGERISRAEISRRLRRKGRIYICGGGSRLPEIRAALAADRFWKRLSFARPPEVIVMAPDQVESITDATELLVDQQDVTPMGLAFQAIELQTTEDPLDAALRRVLRAMKV